MEEIRQEMTYDITMKRVDILEELRQEHGLKTLVDCGANNFIYNQLGYDEIIAIEKDPTYKSTKCKLVYGEFMDHFEEFMQDDTCFTYMSYLSESKKHKENFNRIEQAIRERSLKNCCLIHWKRPFWFHQEYEIIKF